MTTKTCPGCRVELEPFEGPTHRYIESSPACWAKYGELLAREYEDRRFMTVHRLTVDAYAVQHPGQDSPQAVRSVAGHLISLHAIFEHDLPVGQATPLLRRMRDFDDYVRLERPVRPGTLDVLHPLAATTAEEHESRVRAWARSAYESWAREHQRIADWYRRLRS
ncbi:MAG: hypothetical protein H6807_10190 [Planctomycetes bacterium]|nr:hypothetical protein [Planctomycetota bacterium]